MLGLPLGLGLSQRGGSVLGTGDPMTATVRADGWTVEVKWKGFVDGGTASLDPAGSPKLILAVSDTGFGTNRVLGSKSRTVIGTLQLRQPYPNQTLPVDAEDAEGASRVFVLSEPVFAGSTVGGDFKAGLYIDNGTDGSAASSNARLFSVSNSSAKTYPDPVANWACSANLRGGTEGFAFEVYADHQFAYNGSPVAAVGVRVVDSASNVSWGYATALEPSAQVSGTDPVKLVYKVTVPTTGMTDGAATAHLVVYPWLASEAWDSATDGATWPTPQVASIPVLIDRAGNYTEVYAALDTAAGNDGTGVVSASKTTAQASPFLTVSAARAALKTHNNARGHNDNAAGYILLKQDISGFGHNLRTNWTTGLTWGGFDVWTTTGAKTIGITEAGDLNNRQHPNLCEFRNLFIRPTGSNTYALDGAVDDGVSGLPATYARFVNCKFSGYTASASLPEVYRTGLMDYIGCEFTDASNYALRHFGVTRVHHRLHLGTTYATSSTAVQTALVWTAIGCSWSNVVLNSAAVSANQQLLDGQIVANCKLMTCRSSSQFASSVTTRGVAVVQCVFEKITTTDPAMYFSGDSTVNAVQNAILRHNTVAGQRCNVLYQDTGTAYILKQGVAQYNLLKEYNNKSDLFAPANANRTGNWEHRFGVNNKGNHWITAAADASTTGSASAWVGDYMGLRTTCATATSFTSDASFTGTALGGGNYLPTGTITHLQNKVAAGEAAYPVDIRNTARLNNGGGSCGAYEVGV